MMYKNSMFLFMTLLIMLAVIGGCIEKEANQQPAGGDEIMPKKGKILFIVAQKDFRDEELIKPKKILDDAGYATRIASITTDFAYGAMGAKVKPDLAVKDAKAGDYEYVVVVGGSGAPKLADYPEVLELLVDAKKVAAICAGPTVLARAGVLDGKNATVYKSQELLDALKQRGAIFLDKSVVVDGTTVTANGPGAAEEFGKKLLEVLEKR